MKKLLTLCVVWLACYAGAQTVEGDTLKYRINLRDKAATTYKLSEPEAFLSAKAIERRQRQGLSVDSTDLPVCQTYVDQIAAVGVKIVVTGKWENFVTVSTNDPALIEQIAALPFVASTENVWIAPPPKPKRMFPGGGDPQGGGGDPRGEGGGDPRGGGGDPQGGGGDPRGGGGDPQGGNRPQADSTAAPQQPPMPMRRPGRMGNELVHHEDSLYGPATRQILLHHADKLHEAGFSGQGMTIAVVDAGFMGVDKMDAMSNVRILGQRDFVNPSGTVYDSGMHGTAVLSCIAMNRPYEMMGTAPEAEFYLFRTEDEDSEQTVEQDYWAAAVECADSAGVDVINTSLGYVALDHPHMAYRMCELDGQHALISRQAGRLADKGIVLTCSAGNEGDESWKKIGVPADADGILTVGAVDEDALLTNFSSVGNTSDGRVKPDVVAMGKKSCVIMPNGLQGNANGTSFSSPIMCGMVACLWQACPTLTAHQLIELVRSAGDRYDCPDNIYGYGLPDMWAAYQSYLNKE